jgi:hypothetical protein
MLCIAEQNDQRARCEQDERRRAILRLQDPGETAGQSQKPKSADPGTPAAVGFVAERPAALDTDQ